MPALVLLFAILLAACADKAADSDPSAPPGDSDAAPPDPVLEFTGDRPQSLLMISLDTTQRAFMGRYAGDDTTPRIDALLDHSFVFDDHRSCSNWTYASVICVQAGMTDVEAGFIPSTGEDFSRLPETITLAPELMSRWEYRTDLVSANIFFGDDVGTSQGFDSEVLQIDADAEIITAEAVLVLDAIQSEREEDPEQRWYLHAHYLDPHTPYSPPGDYLDGIEDLPPIEYDLDTPEGTLDAVENYRLLDPEEQAALLEHMQFRYRAELRYVDAQIGALLDAAEERGLLEDTLVVFWTDHGEQIWEHGDLGHSDGLYEEENRAVVGFWAENLTPGDWSGRTVHPDIWPTAAVILDLPDDTTFTGLPVGLRDDAEPRFALRHDGDGSIAMVEVDETKLIYRWDGTKELYRRIDDPLERSNVYDPQDPEVIALWDQLTPFLEEIQRHYPDFEPIDPGP